MNTEEFEVLKNDGGSEDRKRPLVKPSVRQYAFSCVAEKANEHLAMCCFTSGVSFHCFENPHFIEFCNILNNGYNPPSRKVIAGSLLDKIDNQLNLWKTSILQKEIYCLTSDGYTNVKAVNLVNFEALTKFGPIHVDTIQRTSAEITKDAEFIAAQIIEIVMKLGGTNRVVGFVSDNESTMRSVWEIWSGNYTLSCAVLVFPMLATYC